MSNVKEFYNALSNDPALCEKISLLNEKFKEDKNFENVAPEIAAIAKENGFDFTVEELLSYEEELKNSRPLDEEALAAVSGGFFEMGICNCAFCGGGANQPVTILGACPASTSKS